MGGYTARNEFRATLAWGDSAGNEFRATRYGGAPPGMNSRLHGVVGHICIYRVEGNLFPGICSREGKFRVTRTDVEGNSFPGLRPE